MRWPSLLRWRRRSYQRGDMLVKSGWLTLPGSTDPVAGAVDICVQKLMSANLKMRPPVEVRGEVSLPRGGDQSSRVPFPARYGSVCRSA